MGLCTQHEHVCGALRSVLYGTLTPLGGWRPQPWSQRSAAPPRSEKSEGGVAPAPRGETGKQPFHCQICCSCTCVSRVSLPTKTTPTNEFHFNIYVFSLVLVTNEVKSLRSAVLSPGDCFVDFLRQQVFQKDNKYNSRFWIFVLLQPVLWPQHPDELTSLKPGYRYVCITEQLLVHKQVRPRKAGVVVVLCFHWFFLWSWQVVTNELMSFICLNSCIKW